MTKYFLKIAVLATLLSQVACSQRWYNVSPGADSDEINGMVSESQGVQAQSYDYNLVDDIYFNDAGASVYFKKSSSEFRPENLLQVYEMGSFMNGAEGLNIYNVGPAEVSIMFVDGISAAGDRRFAFLIRFGADGGIFAATSEVGAYSFTDDSFAVEITGLDGAKLLLETYDLDPKYSETLGTNVRFTIYRQDSSGRFIYIGQTAPLAGLEG